MHKNRLNGVESQILMMMMMIYTTTMRRTLLIMPVIDPESKNGSLCKHTVEYCTVPCDGGCGVRRVALN